MSNYLAGLPNHSNSFTYKDSVITSKAMKIYICTDNIPVPVVANSGDSVLNYAGNTYLFKKRKNCPESKEKLLDSPLKCARYES
jgi:hypothetical protein